MPDDFVKVSKPSLYCLILMFLFIFLTENDLIFFKNSIGLVFNCPYPQKSLNHWTGISNEHAASSLDCKNVGGRGSLQPRAFLIGECL